MNIALALIESLKFGLSLLNTKESRKYLDEVLALEQRRYEEENKPEDRRNHAYLDNIDHRLCLISQATSGLNKSDVAN